MGNNPIRERGINGGNVAARGRRCRLQVDLTAAPGPKHRGDAGEPTIGIKHVALSVKKAAFGQVETQEVRSHPVASRTFADRGDAKAKGRAVERDPLRNLGSASLISGSNKVARAKKGPTSPQMSREALANVIGELGE